MDFSKRREEMGLHCLHRFTLTVNETGTVALVATRRAARGRGHCAWALRRAPRLPYRQWALNCLSERAMWHFIINMHLVLDPFSSTELLKSLNWPEESDQMSLVMLMR